MTNLFSKKSISFKKVKSLYLGFSLLLLIYMLWPTPDKISDFKPLPNSAKSKLAGDTFQIPNVSAYFSNNYRDFVVKFYQQNFKELAKLPIPSYRLNYPPEYSFVAIKKHTDTTYIEELVYPLKGSLFVNGYEPFNPDRTPKFWGASMFDIEGVNWDTKTTLRLYPSSVFARLIVWLGITVSILLLYRLFRKVFI